MESYRSEPKIHTNRAYIPDNQRNDLDKYKELKNSPKDQTRWDGDDYYKKDPYDIKRNSNNYFNDINVPSGKQSRQPYLNNKAPKSSKSNLCKIFTVIGVIAGVCLIAGGAAGLAYYLGTLNTQINNVTVNNSVAYTGTQIDTVILTDTEKTALVSITSLRTFKLLYRASRDGFFASVFHSKCDNINPTLTLIRSNLSGVFGGYTNALWNTGGYKSDSTAYIFSLRRRGFNSTQKFSAVSCCSHIYGMSTYGPTFGTGHDIYICDNSDIVGSSYTSCSTFSCPPGGNTHLAGTYSFFVSEIEVYQVSL